MRLFYLLPFILIGVLLAVPSAEGGCQKVYSGYSHNQAVYSYPVSNGFHYDNQVVVQPYAIPVVIVPNTFYQVLPELAYARVNQELADAAAEKAARKAVLEILNLLPKPPATTNPTDVSPTIPYSKKDEDKNLSLVQKMVDSKCLKCHGKGEAFDLSDLSKLTRNQKLEMVYRIMTDDTKLKMPKGPGTVTPEELNAAHTFVGTGKNSVVTEVPEKK